MDTSTPKNPTADTYIDIENAILDKYLPRIGVYGFGVYVAIKRHLAQTSSSSPPSYATIARQLGMDQGAVIRHVKKLQRLKLLSPTLHFIEERSAKRRDKK
jgi:DNA-binding MarR family transcriptional regulator